MIEVWKYWWQLVGLLPSDEMQKLRAENELLKVQLDLLKQRDEMVRSSGEFMSRVQELNEEAIKGWKMPGGINNMKHWGNK